MRGMEPLVDDAPEQEFAGKSPIRRWAPLLFLLLFVAAVPAYYNFVMIPRLRVAAFLSIMEDTNAQGKVAFIDEHGSDAQGLMSGKTGEMTVQVISVKDGREPDAKAQDPGTGTVKLKDLKWTGSNTFEVSGGLYFGKDIGSGATFSYTISLFGCEMQEVRDRWAEGELTLAPVETDKEMPKLQGMQMGGGR